jgi:hypothetical protein
MDCSLGPTKQVQQNQQQAQQNKEQYNPPSNKNKIGLNLNPQKMMMLVY